MTEAVEEVLMCAKYNNERENIFIAFFSYFEPPSEVFESVNFERVLKPFANIKSLIN